MTVIIEWSVEYVCTNCGKRESAEKNDPKTKQCPYCNGTMELHRADTSQRKNRGRYFPRRK